MEKIVSSLIFYSRVVTDKDLSSSSDITCNILPGVLWALDKRIIAEMLKNVSNNRVHLSALPEKEFTNSTTQNM